MSPEAKKLLHSSFAQGFPLRAPTGCPQLNLLNALECLLGQSLESIWSIGRKKAIPYIRNKLNEQIPTEGTLLHKIIAEDSIVLRTPTPRVPNIPSDTDQDSLSRGALAELTLVDPTEHHLVGDEPSEAPTAQVRIHSENENTGTYNPEVTVERGNALP